jgi:hypothetical protein
VTADGLRLGLGFMARAASSPRATVLVFNGNAGDRSFRAPLAAALNQARFSVLLFDDHGYGKKSWQPIGAGPWWPMRARPRHMFSYAPTSTPVAWSTLANRSGRPWQLR